MNDSIKVGSVEIPNPVGIVLNILFPNHDKSGNGVPDTSSIDPDLGMSQNDIQAAAQSADQAFSAIIVAAGSAAAAATAPGGAPFVASASAAVAAYWSSLPAKEKASIWKTGGPISPIVGNAAQNQAAKAASRPIGKNGT